uniref:Uncharacterized protein n=1 Tax=Quercus lobata TaxID=97700 RepID=A0A7N2RB63_QUELO
MVSSFIRAAEEVVKEIEEAAEKGELNELVLMVICNCLDFARLDEATPAMRLLYDLLNMHDGFDDEGWLKEFKNRMVDTFPRENLFSVLVPTGNEINKSLISSANQVHETSWFALWLPIDLFLEYAMDKSSEAATSAVEIFTGRSQSLYISASVLIYLEWMIL